MRGAIAPFVISLWLSIPAAGAEVRVFAAASLTEALEEIGRRYQGVTGDDVVFNFSASSLLARQIELGAPADLFLSADQEKMDALERRGKVLRSTRISILSNALVVVVSAKSRARIRDAADLVRLQRIALADPRSVPAGVYARTWLERRGVWTRVAPRVIPTESVRAALAAVASGNVDAAIVYRTDARVSRRVRVAYEVPRDAAPPISYPFAVLTGAESPAPAARFLTFLTSPAGRDVFRRHGFVVR